MLGFSAGQGWPWFGPLGCAPAKETNAFRVILEAWQLIQRHYVDRGAVIPRNMAHGSVAGMVASLGDVGHSTFVPPSMVKQLEQAERGQLQGVGVEVESKEGRATVVAPIEDSPAMRAGIKPGDVILNVDHKPVEGVPLSEVAARVSGRPGTSVSLTILTPSTGAKREVTLVRAAVRLHSVTWGVCRKFCRPPPPGALRRKHRHRAAESLAQIRQDNANSLVLDLRNNPGGILDVGVAVASEFLSGGNVLYIKNAEGDMRAIPVIKGGTAQHLPLAVLVNGGSASAAEIVAGALQDARRAPLIGETTFGTGTVLQEFKLSDGSAMLLAVQEWLTPSRRSFWHKGIAPDIVVAMTNRADLVTPRDLPGMTRAQLEKSPDTQLLRALETLSAAGQSSGQQNAPVAKSAEAITR